MNVHEWALISFTILTQLSVGSFLCLRCIHYFAARKAGEVEADQLSDRSLLVIGPALILGMLSSLFHLGDYLSAYRALANIGSSWLSMEIFFGTMFAAIGGLFAVLQWFKLGSTAVRNIIGWIASLIGLSFVYSMSKLYMLETVPTWNSPATPISFFTTSFLLGALALAVVFVANYHYLQRAGSANSSIQNELLRDSIRWITIFVILLLGVEFVTIPANMAYLTMSSTVAATAVAETVSEYAVLLVLRLALVFIGAGFLGLFLYRNTLSPGREKMLGYMTYSSFAIVLISELLGRFLFYASYAGIGI